MKRYLLAILLFFVHYPASASPYYLSADAWQCPGPGSLLGRFMYRRDSQCIPPLSGTPQNVTVMDIEGPFAFICNPLYIEGLKITSIFCGYVLSSSIVDASGKQPDLAILKAYAGRQTMQNVKK
jgi:hypothetical protein